MGSVHLVLRGAKPVGISAPLAIAAEVRTHVGVVERMDAEHAERGLLERDGDAVERAHMLGVRRLGDSCACGQWSGQG